MYKELNTLGVKDCNYFSLVRKSDGVEVYTSLSYLREENVFDYDKIKSTLNFYFERVNSGIEQQKQSPKLSEEQKNQLKLLDKKDYVIKYKKLMPNGMIENVYWKEEAEDFIS